MRRIVGLALATSALMAAALPAAAQSCSYSWWSFWSSCSSTSTGGTTSGSVPEIDAGAGLLAVAAVIAVALFVRERRKRSA